jgi:hypothetical protein
MSKAVATISRDLSAKIEAVLMRGDLAGLNETERVQYHNKVCESVGLNPLTKPFEYIKLNGKLTLYAKRDATDQLRKVHSVSITITAREMIGDIYVVTARAKDKDGREDESTGAVNVANLKGDNLANAYMKAETKAKRRVTLSICGLGLLDESEVESIPVEKDVSPKSEGPPKETKLKNYAPQSNPLKESDDPGEYTITVGGFTGTKVKDCDPKKLETIVLKLIEAANDPARAKKMSKGYQELMQYGGDYLQKIEATPLFDESEDFPDV